MRQRTEKGLGIGTQETVLAGPDTMPRRDNQQFVLVKQAPKIQIARQPDRNSKDPFETRCVCFNRLAFPATRSAVFGLSLREMPGNDPATFEDRIPERRQAYRGPCLLRMR